MSDKNPENFGENNDEFGEEDKVKPINETSNFKGRSCFKKEKDKDTSKIAVKIVEPESKKEDEAKEEFKERRKRKPQFKTVKEPSELKTSEYLTLNGNEGENIMEPEQKKFVRKGKRSTTLKERTKLSQKLLAEEMNLQVKQENLIIQEKGNPSKKYKPTKLLGTGSFGSVYEAKNTIFQNIVAMKVINKDPNNSLDEQEIRNEIDILKKLSHPNIVKIYEFYISNSHYYIVTEFCRDGELFSYIKNKYSERQLAVLFYQVFSGLWYLHDNKILHRDIKLENIMISQKEKDYETGEELFWVKIIDFGTAKIFEKNKKEKDVVGSSYYIAPEVLQQNYNEKCDTWSVGVILYMMLVGRAPFDGKDDEEIILKINSADYNSKEPKLMKHSPEVRDLVSKLLQKDTDKRYSAREAIAHPWFQKYGGRSLYSNFKREEIEPYINNLFNYYFNSKIQQLVIAFLVHNLPNDDSSITVLKLFRHFNKSGSCKLTKEELMNGLYDYRNKNDVDKVVDHLFRLLDGDNNGFIEYEEFLRACIDKKTILKSTYLKYAFKFLDKEKTGTLNTQKIIKAFVLTPNKLIEAVFNNTLNSVDHDSDGIINFEEFQELMMKCMD
jgi:calcium-dependent protein kinase